MAHHGGCDPADDDRADPGRPPQGDHLLRRRAPPSLSVQRRARPPAVHHQLPGEPEQDDGSEPGPDGPAAPVAVPVRRQQVGVLTDPVEPDDEHHRRGQRQREEHPVHRVRHGLHGVEVVEADVARPVQQPAQEHVRPDVDHDHHRRQDGVQPQQDVDRRGKAVRRTQRRRPPRGRLRAAEAAAAVRPHRACPARHTHHQIVNSRKSPRVRPRTPVRHHPDRGERADSRGSAAQAASEKSQLSGGITRCPTDLVMQFRRATGLEDDDAPVEAAAGRRRVGTPPQRDQGPGGRKQHALNRRWCLTRTAQSTARTPAAQAPAAVRRPGPLEPARSIICLRRLRKSF